MSTMGGHEGMEAAVQVDVIRNQYAAWFEGFPSVIQLEKQVSLGMPAVVYKQVDRF